MTANLTPAYKAADRFRSAGTPEEEIAEGLKLARVRGESVHDGQRVRGGHLLEEGDVVEIHG